MRTRPAAPVLLFLALLPALCASAVPARSPQREKGGRVVVREVDPGLAGERSGLKAEDLLLDWSWAPAAGGPPRTGSFTCPLDLERVEFNLMPAGPVTVRGSRAGQPLAWTLAGGDLSVATRPDLAPADLEAHRKALASGPKGGPDPAALAALADALAARSLWAQSVWARLQTAQALARAKRLEEATQTLEQAIALARGHLSPERTAMLLSHGGGMLSESGDLKGAASMDARALEAWKRAPEGASEARALSRLAEDAFVSGDLDGAEKGYTAALASFEAAAPGSYLWARAMGRLGEIAWSRGDLDRALEHFQKAYDVTAKIAPEGLEMVGPANNIGKVLFRKGDLAGAETIFRRGVSLQEKAIPGSLDLARSLNGLGLIVTERGDSLEAEALLKRAVAIWEAKAPGSPNGWRPLSNLGNVHLYRGDLAQAEACYARALEMVRRIAPGSLQESAALGNLAAVALDRGDLDTAETLFRQVLEITQKKAPGSPDLARCYQYLATVEHKRGRTEKALEYCSLSAALLREKTPHSPQLGKCLRTWATVSIEAGRVDAAVPLLEEALGLFAAVNPQSCDTASAHLCLGISSQVRGDLPGAEARLRRAVALLEAPGLESADLAEARLHLAQVLRATGRKNEAREELERALRILESLRQRLGGSSEDQASFLSENADYYFEYEELLLEMGEPAEAFRTVERWRAAEFLKMLTARDIDLGAQLSPEVERERRLAAAELDRVASSLSGDAPLSPEEKAALEVRLRAAQKRLEEVRLKTLERSPEVYALRYPQPAGVAETLAALDEGTLLLEYSVCRERAVLYAFGPGKREFSAVPLSTSGRELGPLVDRFRGLIRAGAQGPEPSQKGLQTLATKLSGLLLGPVAGRVSKAERLLVAPDGPLYYLPFSALAAPAPKGRPSRAFQFLIAVEPVHVVTSATVYSQLLRRRGASAGTSFEAFGDPDYSRGAPAGLWRGGELTPLPATRREVESLRETLGAGVVHLGPEATAATALALPRNTRIVHFACHGYADERRPMESALALSAGPGDDGLLSAWAVCERLRVDADLVTLSACDTGLGQVLRGEGLVGLTRAFQFAGARTVLASLWPVNDEGTAELMRRFYANLKGGDPKDEALRKAQLSLLGEGGKRAAGPFAAPYHWAAFQLVGDWR